MSFSALHAIALLESLQGTALRASGLEMAMVADPLERKKRRRDLDDLLILNSRLWIPCSRACKHDPEHYTWLGWLISIRDL